MKTSIHISVIDGEIHAPTSKSYTIRAITGALLSDGYSIILNPALCDDVKSAVEVAESFGAEVEKSNNSFLIKGGLNLKSNSVNCGESALCARLFSAIAPLLDNEITITGQGSLLKRNFKDLEQSLMRAGIKCESNNSYLPIKICGKFTQSEIDIDCSVSSQFLSGLLYALPTQNINFTINVTYLHSKSYINLTLDILNKFGIKIKQKELKEFKIMRNQKYSPTNITIEGDWSNTAFMLVAGAISGRIKVKGLNINSYQGDRKILEILDKVGAIITIDNECLQIKKNKLRSFSYDATDTPDLFPPLVSLASNCKGTSEILGIHRLLNKESNRLNALISEFSKFGVDIYSKNDSLFITGGKIKGCVVESHNDHRIAMALAIAGINSDEPVIINNSECVSKSYPEFFKDLKNIGGKIDE